jgi:hypothetical protein
MHALALLAASQAFHRQMLETGSSLLFDGEYAVSTRQRRRVVWCIGRIWGSPQSAQLPLRRNEQRLAPVSPAPIPLQTPVPVAAVPANVYYMQPQQGQQQGAFSGQVAPYSQHVYYPQQQQQGGGGYY